MPEKDVRFKYITAGDLNNTEEEIESTGLTVCDPLYGLDKEAAIEVLQALGLKPDPKHVKLVRKRTS